MTLTPQDSRTPAARLRQARRQLIDQGQVADDLVGPVLRGSWMRSQQFGLQPVGRASGAPHASGAQLARARAQQHELVAHAQPVMDFLFEQTRDSDSMVILADPQGMLLHALGDASFIERAERVALRPGAIWHEQWRGTNAIGTALAEGRPVVVHAGEHYLERNAFLTCTAAPILDPVGRLLGALDISGEQRSYHRHTLGLVRSAARMIEHRLFEHRHGGGLRLRLHAHSEGLGTVTEGLLALSPDGWILGANAAALQWLGLAWQDVGARRIESVLALDLATLGLWSRQAGALPRALRRPDGQALWARLEAGRAVVAVAPRLGTADEHSTAALAIAAKTATATAAPSAADALTELDTGDAAMQAAVSRARRVLGKPIALLLQGESGTGKEVFARAVHASGPRRHAPLVAVNCAALPEHLIEAELFGYRPGAFTGASREGAPGRIREAEGGTLFLDEIGDMPLALQARLLRVLQDHQVTPLGGGKPVAVDFALVCATHRKLRDEMEAGRFREDLYYRLNGLTLQLPALRERQDLGSLVRQMLASMAPGRALQLAPDVASAFAAHRWPGNLRQLHNALQTACALLTDDEAEIHWAHLPDDLGDDLGETLQAASATAQQARHPAPADQDLRAQAGRSVQQAVQDCQGNLAAAARRLGISRNTLYRKLKSKVP
jgi:transcriptional regulator of acetoin/glycerol metabolism